MAKYSKKRAFSPVALIILILGVALLAVILLLVQKGKTPDAEPTVPGTTQGMVIPATTEPVTTEPITTIPPTTVPETTVPETTEPETTEPETTEPATTEPEITVTLGESIAFEARVRLGTDCNYSSTLVYDACKSVGLNVPYSVNELAVTGVEVSAEELLPGDVLFFGYDENDTAPQYCGIYSGDGRFIYYSGSKSTVIETTLNDYYRSCMVTARRFA